MHMVSGLHVVELTMGVQHSKHPNYHARMQSLLLKETPACKRYYISMWLLSSCDCRLLKDQDARVDL